jgi:TetR/AcrR family transcriptional regulator, regulator of cefoperazone and chloramphenicol sensitivity
MSLSEDPRERLLSAAGEIFAEKGCRAATVREIVRQAGANIAAVNYYFGDKEHLYLETVRCAAQQCGSGIPLPAWAPGTPPEQKLRDFIRTFLARVAPDREPMWFGRLILREMSQPTPACAEFVRQFVRPNFEALQMILGELLPADVPPLKRYLIGFSIVGQCLHYRVAHPVVTLLLGEEGVRCLDVDTLTEHITEFSLAALGKAKGVEP